MNYAPNVTSTYTGNLCEVLVGFAPKKHKHHDLIIEKARQDASGETEAGWWAWEIRNAADRWDACYLRTLLFDAKDYRYTMTDRHPQYKAPQPKLKLIDMMLLPKGTVVCTAGEPEMLHEILGVDLVGKTLLLHATLLRSACSFFTRYLRIAEQKEFTFWRGGVLRQSGCPVPEGVTGEIIQRNGIIRKTSVFWSWDWRHYGPANPFDIIGYRITGVANGWTDDPEKAK